MNRTILLLAALLVATPAPAQKPARPAGAPGLRELPADWLLQTGWESENIDLDYEAAIAAYRELVGRAGIEVVLRIKAYQRLYAIWMLTARYDELTRVTRVLVADSSLPSRYRQPLVALLRLLVEQGPRAQRTFQDAHDRFKKAAAKVGKPAHSAERDALRRTFIRELRRRMQALNEAMRIDFSLRPSGLRGLQALVRAAGQSAHREKDLRDRSRRITKKLREIEVADRAGTEAYRRLRIEQRRVENQLRALLRRKSSSPSERRRVHELRRLEQQIDQLHDAGKHDRADTLIDRAERLRRGLPPALRRRFWTLRAALRNPVVRRRVLRELAATLREKGNRLPAGGDPATALAAWAARTRPLLARKNWKDAARVTEAFAAKHGWFGRLWRRASRRR